MGWDNCGDKRTIDKKREKLEKKSKKKKKQIVSNIQLMEKSRM